MLFSSLMRDSSVPTVRSLCRLLVGTGAALEPAGWKCQRGGARAPLAKRSRSALRLYSISSRTEHRNGNSVIFRRLKSLPETLKSLLTIFAQFPKLDVAGSNPVSRSIFSITYEKIGYPPYPPLRS
jgi:hypothetical protein